jgi:formate dehydrogenase subunit gamma
VLTLAVLFHIVRSSIWQSLAAIVPGPRDVVDSWRIFRHTVIDRSTVLRKQGKYSVAQKLIHTAVTVVVLTVVVTGLLMLAKIDTSFWQRNPYFLAQRTWGIIYVLHGYAAMALITLVIIHVYFGLRPEKLYFTRSMILGWVTRNEYNKTFDSGRWAPREAKEPSLAPLEASERPTGA